MSTQVFEIEGKGICVDYDFFIENLKKFFQKRNVNADTDILIFKAFNKDYTNNPINYKQLANFEDNTYLTYYNLQDVMDNKTKLKNKLMILYDGKNGEYVCLMYPKKAKSVLNTIVPSKWEIEFKKLPSYDKITKEIIELFPFLKNYKAQKISKKHSS